MSSLLLTHHQQPHWNCWPMTCWDIWLKFSLGEYNADTEIAIISFPSPIVSWNPWPGRSHLSSCQSPLIMTSSICGAARISQELSPWSRRTTTFSSWMGHLTLSLTVCLSICFACFLTLNIILLMATYAYIWWALILCLLSAYSRCLCIYSL